MSARDKITLEHLAAEHQALTNERMGSVYTHCSICSCPAKVGHYQLHGHKFDRSKSESA